MLYLVIVLAIFIFACYIYYKHFRAPKLGTFVMVTGGVKCGKSTSSVANSIRDYKRRLRSVKFYNWLIKFLHLNKTPRELPCYYSNVPINVKGGYVPITSDLLLRKARFRYGSVVYLQECSFVAGSTDYGVESIDDAIKEFCKLIGHETKGGCLYVDTQSVSDLHNGFRRSCSMELYIYKTVKVPILPFLICYYKQLYYNEDGQLVNVNVKNADDDLRKMIYLSSVWKKFDCYCYSCLTDDLPVIDNKVIPMTYSDLKAHYVLKIKDLVKKEKELKKERLSYEKKKFV